MKSNKYIAKVLAAFVGALTLGSQSAVAENDIGFVELQLGIGIGSNSYTDPFDSFFNEDTASANSTIRLQGAYLVQIGSRGSAVLNGSLLKTNIGDSDILNGADLDFEANLSVHGLYKINEKVNLGAFLGAAFVDHGYAYWGEKYTTRFGGLEAHFTPIEKTTFFIQAGAGEDIDNNNVSSGFEGGNFVRLGAFHTFETGGIISADFEFANSDEYEDADEPGAFSSYALTYEKDLMAWEKTTFSAGIRQSVFDAEVDGDKFTETTAFVGLRFNFGGSTAVSQKKAGLIGTPYLPARAASWVPALD